MQSDGDQGVQQIDGGKSEIENFGSGDAKQG